MTLHFMCWWVLELVLFLFLFHRPSTYRKPDQRKGNSTPGIYLEELCVDLTCSRKSVLEGREKSLGTLFQGSLADFRRLPNRNNLSQHSSLRQNK